MTDAPPHDPEPHTGYTSKDVVDAAYAKGVSFNLQNWNAITANDAVYPVSIYSIIPGGDYSAVSYFSKISEQTGGKLYTTNSSEDIANALLDITDNITHTSGETPESVPEPSPVIGLLTVVFALLGLSRLKCKKPLETSSLTKLFSTRDSTYVSTDISYAVILIKKSLS